MAEAYSRRRGLRPPQALDDLRRGGARPLRGGRLAGEDDLVIEYGGDTLSRYDVSPGAPKLEAVATARLFATRHRPPQLKLFALEDAPGRGGWLTALALDGYAARSRNKPEALQEVLFSYLEAL